MYTLINFALYINSGKHHGQNMEHIVDHTWYCQIFSGLIHPSGYVVLSHCGFNSHLPLGDVEQMSLLVICEISNPMSIFLKNGLSLRIEF